MLQSDQKILLYILTGDSRILPKQVRPQRKRKRRWKLEGEAPDNPKPQKRFKRCNPRHPNMNEARAWRKETMFESRSHQITEEASKAKRVHIMSNSQSTFTGAYRERPSHRDMTAGERAGNPHPKIGPKIMR